MDTGDIVRRKQAPAATLTLHRPRPDLPKGSIVRMHDGTYWIVAGHTNTETILLRPPWYKSWWWELCDTFAGIFGYDD